MQDPKRSSIPPMQEHICAGARSYFRGFELTRENLQRPILGAANTWLLFSLTSFNPMYFGWGVGVVLELLLFVFAGQLGDRMLPNNGRWQTYDAATQAKVRARFVLMLRIAAVFSFLFISFAFYFVLHSPPTHSRYQHY